MSVNAVAMFYGKLAADQIMAKEFARASSACAIKFAAERGYMFTEYDLQAAGQVLHGFAKQFGNDVKQLHHHVASQAVSRGVGQAAAQGGKAAAQGAKAARGGNAAGMSPFDANSIMSTIEFGRVLGRVGEIVGGISGGKKKKG